MRLSRSYSNDANGNLTKRIDRLGRETDYVYDTLNRQTAEKWYEGASLVRTISYQDATAGFPDSNMALPN